MNITALLASATAQQAASSQPADGSGKNRSAPPASAAKPFADRLQSAIQSAANNPDQRSSLPGQQPPLTIRGESSVSTAGSEQIANLGEVLGGKHIDPEESLELAAEPGERMEADTGLALIAAPQGLALTTPLHIDATQGPGQPAAAVVATHVSGSQLVGTPASALSTESAAKTEITAAATNSLTAQATPLNIAAAGDQQARGTSTTGTVNTDITTANLVTNDGSGITQPVSLTSTNTPTQSQPVPAAPLANSSINGSVPVMGASLGSDVWGTEFSQHLLTMAHRGEKQIDLYLHPRELGSLSVSLNLDDQSVRAQFLSANAAVRSAVEQALPQLRETLAQQGIALGETSVGQQQQQASQQQQTAQQEADGKLSLGPAANPADSLDDSQTTISHSLPTRTSGIDLYA
ncbi:flagellar hook-length control protein FliK [uncultured Microbulbifer sp.]|uniref:flagellar hook-length control protein FliK n=1 Tax=uncultured Microbulbifer sp. TaxID=348147 RepID=UPI0026233658|nr:flagellar hook-length control protein FliK [uncultured Microbulbifer sp.]